MPAYQVITSTRTTVPDLEALLASLRSTIAPDIGLAPLDGQRYSLKKGMAWQPAEVAQAQSLIDTGAALTPQRAAQTIIDNMPIFEKAIILTLLDETNRLRAALRGLGVTGLPDISVDTMIKAVRTKAGGL